MSNTLLTAEQSAALLTLLDWAIPIILSELNDGAPVVSDDTRDDLDLTAQLIDIAQTLCGQNTPRPEDKHWREALTFLNACYFGNQLRYLL